MPQPSSDANCSKESVAKPAKPLWVAPSFGNFTTPSVPPPSKHQPPAKRQKRNSKEENNLSKTAISNASASLNARQNSKLSWVDKYSPVSRADLAVHPKKVEEVYAWLEKALKLKKAPMLVITGPPGTGKTATLRVAAREMPFLLREWITPVNSNIVTEDVEGNKKFDSSYRSEYDLVKDFLLRSSRYPSVLAGEQNIKKSVVLLEDMPLSLLRDPGVFQELLWEYTEDGMSPLVMIIGDNKTFRKLFPDQFVYQLQIKVIDFNPVAMTIMTKLLQSITQQESQNVANQTFQSPSLSVISSIYESSCGDLRSAINTLQFACLRGASNTAKVVSGKSHVSPKKLGAKRAKVPKEKETELAVIGGRDAPEDFFRVIGRVLYAKREAADGTQSTRGSLVHNPHDIVNSFLGCADFFTGFLHENYLSHFSGSLTAAEQAADYLCDADIIMSSGMYNERDLPRQLGMTVAVQGLMHLHPDKLNNPGPGFKPHNKPRSIAASKAYDDRRLNARSLFPNAHCSSYELLTELLPFAAQIGGSASLNDQQLKFIDGLTFERQGSHLASSRHIQTSRDNQTMPAVPPNGLKIKSDEDEEMLIEEFDDSD